MYQMDFLFNELNNRKKKTVFVNEGEIFDEEKGYGFVTAESKKLCDSTRIAELGSGFEFVKSKTDRPIPQWFKVNTEHQGNYKVEIEFTNNGEEFLLFLGRRRLYYRDFFKGTKIFCAIVNVCDIIPRGKEKVYNDTTIDVSWIGSGANIVSLNIKEVVCPTIYVVGDSTLTDQSAEAPYSPGTSYSGWAQMLPAWLNDSVALSNHAHSGLTTESFRKEGHYCIVAQYIKPGDYFLLQFAHNDQKLDHLKYNTGYRENIIRYISEIRSQGAYPVIVTPLARNTWKGNDGTYNDLLEQYADECIKIGKEYDVPVVDLHRASVDYVMEHGLVGSKSFYYPGDYTHTNDYGAYYMAGVVAKGLLESTKDSKVEAYRRLSTYVIEAKPWDVDPKLLELPEKEEPDRETGSTLLDELERPDDLVTRAEALEMVINVNKFFPTNIYSDMFDDVIGHEWFAGCVECAYQNGLIPESMIDAGHLFHPNQNVTLKELLVLLMYGYKSRRELLKAGSCYYDDKVQDEYRPLIRAAVALGVVNDGDDLYRNLTRKEAATIAESLRI